VVDPALAATVRACLQCDDDYASIGKPPCDWDDRAAREALVDALVRDANAALGALDGAEIDGALAEAAALLAVVAGQDVALGDDGCSASWWAWPPIASSLNRPGIRGGSIPRFSEDGA